MKKLAKVLYCIGKVIVAYAILLLTLAIAILVATSSEYGARNSPKFASKEVSVVWQNTDMAACIVTDGHAIYTYETEEPLEVGAMLTLTCFDKGVARDISAEGLTSDMNKMYDLGRGMVLICFVAIMISLVCQLIAAIIAQPKERVEQS